MKQQKTIALMALTAVLVAACPAQVCMAQAPVVAGIRLAATRGQVQFLDSDGRWEKLRGPITAAVGTAVRTARGAEVVATFEDGSTVTLGETSALRFSRIAPSGAGQEYRMKVLGQLAASISPEHVARDTVAFDTPVGRTTINKAFAIARAVRGEVASSVATLKLETPTGRAVRVAVTQGAATLQSFFNVTGVVTATDPEHGTFTLTDAATGRARRVIVGAVTLLARKDEASAHASRTPRSIVDSLTARQNVTVYGEPVSVEGPGDLVAQAEGGAINATVIFPEGFDFLSAEDYVSTPDLTVVGTGVAASAGSTASLTAGSLAPVISAGVSLSGVVASQVAVTGTGVAGAAALSPVLIGAGVAVVAGAVVVVSNDNKGTTNTTPPPTLTSVQLNISRVLSRSRRAAMATTPVALAAPSQILPLSSERGSSLAPSLAVGADGVTGRLPLSHNLQLHVGAQYSTGTESAMTQIDAGIDYLFNNNHALGFGVQTRTINVVDTAGTASLQSTTTPQIRYTIRY